MNLKTRTDCSSTAVFARLKFIYENLKVFPQNLRNQVETKYAVHGPNRRGNFVYVLQGRIGKIL